MTAPVTVRFLDRTTPPHIATLILMAGLSALSLNIFMPSLPAMAAYFSADYRLVQLSVPIYLAVNAALQILIGPISDRFGRRPVLLSSVAVFCAATLGCLLAPTIEIFLVFRMIQGVIVTGMVLSRAVVRDLFPQEQAASMIGYVTMGMAVVPMIGPAVGGFLDETLGWQSSFALLLVLGIALFVLIRQDLGETALNRSTSFAAQVRQYPELLTSRRFWGYCLTAAFSAGAFFAYLGGAPYVGTEVFGLSSSELGLLFGAPAVGYMIGNGISGACSARFGINSMILWGAVLAATGTGISLGLHLLGFRTAVGFFGFMTFVGFGNGMVLPNATAGMLSVRPHLAGTASGLGGAMMIGGGAALSALSGAVLSPGTGAAPLLWIMFLSSLLGAAAIAYVIRREAGIRRT